MPFTMIVFLIKTQLKIPAFLKKKILLGKLRRKGLMVKKVAGILSVNTLLSLYLEFGRRYHFLAV